MIYNVAPKRETFSKIFKNYCTLHKKIRIKYKKGINVTCFFACRLMKVRRPYLRYILCLADQNIS